MIINELSPTNKYVCILADPPWTFVTRSDKGKARSAEQHYSCMSLQEIYDLPVQQVASDNCILFMWVTFPLLREGINTIEAWGFEYKTCGFTWAKLNKRFEGDTYTDKDFFTGMGYHTRQNPELCLIGVKGKVPRKSKAVRNLIVSPRREHSRKPDQTYDRIEALVDGPYLELFSRTEHQGWDCWGNEVCKFTD